MSGQNTSLAVVENASAPTPALLRPIASPATVIEAHKEACAIIEKALEEGRDYGTIPGVERPTLLKPGAERLLNAFGLYVDTVILESEVDHDHVNTYEFKRWVTQKKEPSREEKEELKGRGLGRNKKTNNGWVWQTPETETGTSYGLYRYVVRAEIRRRDTAAIVGTGVGICSSMEAKYIRTPRDVENTILKMAKKRALVDGALNTLGLSDRFTQDVEDMIAETVPESEPVAAPAPSPAESAPANGADPAKRDQVNWWTKQGGSTEDWARLGGRGGKIHELVAEARTAGCTTPAEVISYVEDGELPGQPASPDAPKSPDVIEGEVVGESVENMVGKSSESLNSPSSTDSAAAASADSPTTSPAPGPSTANPDADPFGGASELNPTQKLAIIATLKGTGLTFDDIAALSDAEGATTFAEILALAKREAAAQWAAS